MGQRNVARNRNDEPVDPERAARLEILNGRLCVCGHYEIVHEGRCLASVYAHEHRGDGTRIMCDCPCAGFNAQEAAA